jgi:PAS domain S-box-containing protein
MTTKPTYEELEQKIKEIEKGALERKKTEQARNESEEKWRSLAETAPCVILTVQRDGTIQFLNRTVGNYTPENTVGTKVWDYVPPDHHSVMRKAVEHVFQTGSPIGYEILGAGPEGPASAWYITHLGPILKDGQIVAVTMASTDITEIKKVHEELRESEAQKKAILDASIDRIRLSDTDMRIIWANQTHARELNIHPEELIGKHCYTVFVKRDTPCSECPSIKAIESGQIEHTVLTRPSIKNKDETTYLDSYAVPLKDEAGDIVKCIQITRNITEQLRAVEALQKSEEKYRNLFEDSRDPVYITTREGKLIGANRSFLDLFCITKDEIPDLNVRQLYVNPDDRQSFQKQIEKKGSVKDFEVKLCKKDGTEMDCLLTTTVWRASDRSTLGYQGIIRDITEQKKTERALRQREEELKIQATNLKEVVTALRVLLKQRDEDKTELEEKVLSNVKELVVPFLAKVKKTPLDYKQFSYIDILESNLNDITSPFMHNLSTKYINLTPKEIRVAYLIKEGKTTKEIGEMMGVSPRTIETHRKNIRKKLGIENKKGNLRSRLLTFQ